MTGASNFDITEAIWLKLLSELSGQQATIALLCKTTVARQVLQFAHQRNLPVSHANLHRIDALRWFGAAADACLFSVALESGPCCYEACVYSDLGVAEPESTMGVVQGRLVADLGKYRRQKDIDGTCGIEWRQGVKHDASSVMELIARGGVLLNRLGEEVCVEPEFVYPLLKSSTVFHHRLPSAFVLITQRRLGEDTRTLRHIAPSLWKYLTIHESVFARRRSAIYKGQPQFALFGIGDYSFASYKVAIAGFYGTPRFRALVPVGGRPVLLDDTCYFLPCETPEQACLISALLNDESSLEFIHSLILSGSKRPITKKLLQRIDLTALLGRVDRPSMLARATQEAHRLTGAEPIFDRPLEQYLQASGKGVGAQPSLFSVRATASEES